MSSTIFPSPKNNDSGSSTAGEPDFLVVGKLGRPHGVHGEIVMEVYSDFPERIQPGVVFYIGQEHQRQVLLTRRPHSRGLLVKFEGFQDRDQAAFLRNQLVYVSTADRPHLAQGEYYHHQLIGLQVFDDSGQMLGHVDRILETGANDVCVILNSAGKEILIPAIDPVILDIDLESKILRVHLLEGLLPEDSSPKSSLTP
jgi:16S rRNA processing protein RimM